MRKLTRTALDAHERAVSVADHVLIPKEERSDGPARRRDWVRERRAEAWVLIRLGETPRYRIFVDVGRIGLREEGRQTALAAELEQGEAETVATRGLFVRKSLEGRERIRPRVREAAGLERADRTRQRVAREVEVTIVVGAGKGESVGRRARVASARRRLEPDGAQLVIEGRSGRAVEVVDVAVLAKDGRIPVEDPRVHTNRGACGNEVAMQVNAALWHYALKHETRARMNTKRFYDDSISKTKE